MIVIAIGPQKMLPANGIIPRMAASAVSATGRARRMVASTTARCRPWPASMSRSIWSTKIHGVAHDHAGERDEAQQRDESERPVGDEQGAGRADQPERR